MYSIKRKQLVLLINTVQLLPCLNHRASLLSTKNTAVSLTVYHHEHKHKCINPQLRVVSRKCTISCCICNVGLKKYKWINRCPAVSEKLHVASFIAEKKKRSWRCIPSLLHYSDVCRHAALNLSALNGIVFVHETKGIKDWWWLWKLSCIFMFLQKKKSKQNNGLRLIFLSFFFSKFLYGTNCPFHGFISCMSAQVSCFPLKWGEGDTECWNFTIFITTMSYRHGSTEDVPGMNEMKKQPRSVLVNTDIISWKVLHN